MESIWGKAFREFAIACCLPAMLNRLNRPPSRWKTQRYLALSSTAGALHKLQAVTARDHQKEEQENQRMVEWENIFSTSSIDQIENSLAHGDSFNCSKQTFQFITVKCIFIVWNDLNLNIWQLLEWIFGGVHTSPAMEITLVFWR